MSGLRTAIVQLFVCGYQHVRMFYRWNVSVLLVSLYDIIASTQLVDADTATQSFEQMNRMNPSQLDFSTSPPPR